MLIERAVSSDLSGMLELYQFLNDDSLMVITQEVTDHWIDILSNKDQHILIIKDNDRIVSSVTLTIIKNLTRNLRSYALIENVVTSPEYRKKGLARALMEHAVHLAKENNCYKVMLLTGSKSKEILNFYRSCGFNSEDKTAFIRWCK